MIQPLQRLATLRGEIASLTTRSPVVFPIEGDSEKRHEVIVLAGDDRCDWVVASYRNETATRFEGLTGVRGRRTVGSGLSIWKRKIARPADRRYPLADLLTALGDELREAQRRAREDRREDVLKLKDCSVELAITWEETATGGVEFYVFKLGGELNKTNTQTISVALEPLDEVRVGEAVEIPKG